MSISDIRATSNLFKRDMDVLEPIIKKMNDDICSVTTGEIFILRSYMSSLRAYSDMLEHDLDKEESKPQTRFFHKK